MGSSLFNCSFFFFWESYLIAVDLDGDVKMKWHKKYGLASLSTATVPS